MISSRPIRPCYKGDQFHDSVQRAAQFAVEDDNIVMNSRLKLLSVENAAWESDSKNSFIFYLILKVTLDGAINDMLYKTAVREIASLGIIQSVGLEYVSIASATASSLNKEEEKALPVPHEILRAAEFALQRHNNKKGSHLKLVKVVSYIVFIHEGGHRYALILLAQQHHKNCMMFEAMVVEGISDHIMESCGLIYLCEAKPQLPYTTPDWISLDLITRVRHTFTEQVIALEKPRHSYERPITITMMKSKDSIRQLSTIARSIGEERTRDCLIPFLTADNDGVQYGVLLVMAEQLGELIPYVGGIEHAHVLIPPLEALCTIEQPLVRQKAVESLCGIGAQMKESDFLDLFVPLIKRLGTGKQFTGRASSSGLFHIVYPSAPEDLKIYLIDFYGRRCRDHVAVRKSAASNFGKFAASIEFPYMWNTIILLFADLTHDDQDSVRLLAVAQCTKLVKSLRPESFVRYVLPIVVDLCKDCFWQVRCCMANKLYELCMEVLPLPTGVFIEEVPTGLRENLVIAYAWLFLDDNAIVREAAARNLSNLCMILDPQESPHIVQWMKGLSSDSSRYVRSALASELMNVAPVFGKDAEQLLPIFVSLLKDAYPGVLLNIIRKLDQVNQVIEINKLSDSLVDAIVALAENSDWTVRCSVFKYIPWLKSQLGGHYYEKLDELSRQGVKDEAWSFRDAAAKALKQKN